MAKNSRKGGKKAKKGSAAARKRGKKAWASLVKKHGGVKKAKAALARRFKKGKGKRKGKKGKR